MPAGSKMGPGTSTIGPVVMRRQAECGRWLAVVVMSLSFGLGACSAAVPARPEDACEIFRQHRAWYRDSRRAYERWGVPIHVQLAFVHQESGFRATARPPRRRILWIFPGPRPSSAYGYAQALDSTWKEYRRSTGQGGADRDDFGDAVDFIGWYGHRSSRRLGVGKDDAFRLYLAYHEGDGGYSRGSWRSKGWLVDTAGKVSRRAARYRAQLGQCESEFRRRRWFFGLF